ncbi:hypothetical protein ACJIZ3_013627 [Penstemon smallii]|uniref:Peptidoglycan binding-like domain-containing protein n=1 Tax=Penstemon smallii TaxID=265156 RepID=A0ABD3RHD6_9LAMI
MPLVVDAAKKDEEIVVKEVISIPEKKLTVKRRAILRKGSEGDEVQAMQEALEKLGFYSGEEDMEYSSFASGTERAVKTWQATLGAPEDGIMTSELLEQLFGSSGSGVENNQEHKASDLHKSENGAPINSVTDISQVLVTEDVEVSEHRVFLLGENRWEDPSRLSRSSQLGSHKSSATNKCVTCRGEGRLLCMECDGTGEPNIEEQFMDFLDESAKCPYCEGLGYTICDLCGGTTKA